MRVLIACESSGRVRDAFRRLGHDAWSCDILPTEIPGQHLQRDVLSVFAAIRSGDIAPFDLLIAHPPCDYLANSGVQWLDKKPGRRALMEEGCRFFNAMLSAPVPHICVENPIPHKYAVANIGRYTQVTQPWMFGEKKTKATCLWLRNLAPLVADNKVGPPPKRRHMTPEEVREWHAVHMEAPGPNRKSNRSRTYFGVARALAEQLTTQLFEKGIY